MQFTAKILDSARILQEDENTTIKYENISRGAVVAFLPRLVSGATISIGAKSNSTNGVITTTYDQGSSDPFYFTQWEAEASKYSYSAKLVSYVLETSVLIAFAFLLFAIALRHKRRSKPKLVSDILRDIIKVRNELNNDKGDPNGIILRLHAWHSDIDNERQVVNDYKDYQKIDDFYSAVTSRNCYLLQNEISDDILNILNKDCVNKATTAYTGIDWRKFHKLDLVLLIPAIILSIFVYYNYVEPHDSLC